jgi:hypothetical protein
MLEAYHNGLAGGAELLYFSNQWESFFFRPWLLDRIGITLDGTNSPKRVWDGFWPHCTITFRQKNLN